MIDKTYNMAGKSEPKCNFTQMSPLSQESHRKVIASYLQKGLEVQQILKLTSYTRQQIYRVKKRLNKKNTLRSGKSSGRNNKLNNKSLKKLKSLISKNENCSIRQINYKYNKGKKAEDKIAVSTTHNLFKKMGYSKKKAIKRPAINQNQTKQRMSFIREMRNIDTNIVVSKFRKRANF